MKLTAFQYGKTDLTMRAVFQDGNPNEKMPISLLFFLIETDGRKILVDVGCDTMPGFELFEFKKPVEVMENVCGVTSFLRKKIEENGGDPTRETSTSS